MVMRYDALSSPPTPVLYERGDRDWTVATLLRASPSWQERPWPT
jgi:hypothetical protein